MLDPNRADQFLITEFSSEDRVLIFDIETGVIIPLPLGDFSEINAYSWSPDGSKVAVSYDSDPAIVVYSDRGEWVTSYGSPGSDPDPPFVTSPSESSAVNEKGVWFVTRGGPPTWSLDGQEIAYVGVAKHP